MAPVRRRGGRGKGRGGVPCVPASRMDRGVAFTLDFLTELVGDPAVQKSTVLSVMQYAIRKGLARRRGRDWYQLLFLGGHGEPSDREESEIITTSGGKSPAQASRTPSITNLSESSPDADAEERQEPAAEGKTQEEVDNRGIESYISRLRSTSVSRSDNGGSPASAPASALTPDPDRPLTRARAKAKRGRITKATARS
ncbi:hypothetical protein R5R35_006055 [Gryllus longicercus]|uniref:Uncharacterized protein n=1 Tax=Gryllus longicercus TaxID=2509291 RepID=A0AAN9Z9C5_9ORTH